MRSKNLRNVLITAVVAFSMGIGLAFAGPHMAHRNLEAAQRDLNNAWDHILASQKANEWDEGHHAEKAKQLIQDAKEEVRLAAEYDNHDHDHDHH